MEAPAWVHHWKAILGSVGAVLVVILQIIQLLLSSNIETRVDNNTRAIDTKTEALEDKTAALQEKTNTLSASLAAHGQISKGNRDLLIELHNELHSIEAAATKPKGKK